MSRIISIGLLGALSFSCVHRELLVTTAGASMTHANLPVGKKLASLGEVSDRHCIDAYKTSSGKNVGLIDEAVRSAQKQKNADFIKDVRVYREGNCVVVEGEALKIK